MNEGTRLRIPGPDYQIEIEFSAPLEYVFRWCTDYSPDDAKLEGEKYTRMVVSRTGRRVVYEDLEDGKDGYLWAHMDVSLHPPDRWHVESIGSHRTLRGDYRLTRLGRERTRFQMKWRRAPTPLTKLKMTKAQREQVMRKGWEKLQRALEVDYRRSKRSSR